MCSSTVGGELPSAIARALRCTFTDERGRYRVGGLIAEQFEHAWTYTTEQGMRAFLQR